MIRLGKTRTHFSPLLPILKADRLYMYTVITCTIATRKSDPRRPMARDAAVMTAGPARKRTPMEMPVARHPHAMRFGCSAINNPGHETERECQLARSGGRRRAAGQWPPRRVGAGLIGGAGLRDDRSTRGVGVSVLTQAKHGHPEPGVREDGDGLGHDRRHGDVPPATTTVRHPLGVRA